MAARWLQPLAVRVGRCRESDCYEQTGPLIGRGSLPLRCPPHRSERAREVRRRGAQHYPPPPRRDRPVPAALMVCDWPDCETLLTGYQRRWCRVHARETDRAYWRERARAKRPRFDRTARECAGDGCEAVISVAAIGTPKRRCGPCARKHRNALARQRRANRSRPARECVEPDCGAVVEQGRMGPRRQRCGPCGEKRTARLNQRRRVRRGAAVARG